MGHFRPKKRPFLGTFFNQIVDYEKITQKTNGCHQRIARELNFLGNRFLVPIASSNHVPERPKVASFQNGRFDTCFQPSVFARNICFQGLKMQSLNWARPKKRKKIFFDSSHSTKKLATSSQSGKSKKSLFWMKKVFKTQTMKPSCEKQITSTSRLPGAWNLWEIGFRTQTIHSKVRNGTSKWPFFRKNTEFVKALKLPVFAENLYSGVKKDFWSTGNNSFSLRSIPATLAVWNMVENNDF